MRCEAGRKEGGGMALDGEITAILSRIGAAAVARREAVTGLAGDTAAARLAAMLEAIADAVLPRLLVFAAPDGARLELVARNGRLISGPGIDGLEAAAAVLVGQARRGGRHRVEARLLDAGGEGEGIGYPVARLRAACAAAAAEADDPAPFHERLAGLARARAGFDAGGAPAGGADPALASAAGAALPEIAALGAAFAALGEGPVLIALGAAAGPRLVVAPEGSGTVVARIDPGDWPALGRAWEAEAASGRKS